MIATLFVLGLGTLDDPETDAALRQAVTFHASFDDKPEGDFGAGDRTLWTRSDDPANARRKIMKQGHDQERIHVVKEGVVHGGALHFRELPPTNAFAYFPARGKLGVRKGGWGGAVSLWVKADLDKIPAKGPWDPILVGGKAWNNGAVWVDFAPGKPPRDLRLGLFAALPDDKEPAEVPEEKQPLQRVKAVPFQANVWHHVVLTWDRFDSGKSDASAAVYLDGRRVALLEGRDGTMNWDLDAVRIQPGSGMVGLLDELAVFRRSLTEAEIERLHRGPGLLKGVK